MADSPYEPSYTEPVRGAENPYGVQAAAPVQTAAPKPVSPFNAVPYPKWLQQNSKKLFNTDPHNLTDEQIGQAGFDAYVNGPVKDIIKGRLAASGKSYSEENLDAHATAIANSLKLQHAGALAEKLPELKQMFLAMKPPGAPDVAPTGGFVDSALSGLKRGALAAGQVATGAAAGALEAGAQLNPLQQIAKRVPGLKGAYEGTKQSLQDALFSATQQLGEEAKKVPQVDGGASAKVGEFIGGMVPAILSGGTAAFARAFNAIDEGKTLTDAEKILAKQTLIAEVGAAAGGVPGSLAKRVAAGGVTGGAVGEVARRVENQDLPPEQQVPATPLDVALNVAGGMAGGILSPKGGGFSAAERAKVPFARKPNPLARGDVPKPDTTALTPEQLAGGKAAADINALAEAAKAPVAQAPLAPESAKIINHADIMDADTPAAAQAQHDEWVQQVPPEQRAAFTEAYNQAQKEVNRGKAPQAKPAPAAPAPVAAENVTSGGEGESAGVPPDANKIIDMGGAGQAIADNLYRGWFDRLARKEGSSDAFKNERLWSATREAFDKGEIKSVDDLKAFIKTKSTSPTGPVEPTAAPVAPETAPTPTPTLQDLLAQPTKVQVRDAKGRGTKQNVPVEFVNDTDALAYKYKTAVDEADRALIAAELVKRGVPTEKLQEYGNSVAKAVADSANALKHKVILSDRKFLEQPAAMPLRKPRSPKA